tara:strand:+ start:123 stop:347 length:225 start_codon:yes stop_codon:yes gene_type:complete
LLKEATVEESLYGDCFILANLEKANDLPLKYSLNLPELCDSGDLEVNRRIQKMVFLDGILYGFKNDDYQTSRLN